MGRAVRQRYVQSVRLDASGAGTVTFTANGDVLIQISRVIVVGPGGAANVLQTTANIDVNGDAIDGSQAGNNDTSDTQHLMLAGDILTCRWTGGDVGATATLTLRGIQYEAGQGMAAIAGAG
jgi:hypothetical protein